MVKNQISEQIFLEKPIDPNGTNEDAPGGPENLEKDLVMKKICSENFL